MFPTVLHHLFYQHHSVTVWEVKTLTVKGTEVKFFLSLAWYTYLATRMSIFVLRNGPYIFNAVVTLKKRLCCSTEVISTLLCTLYVALSINGAFTGVIKFPMMLSFPLKKNKQKKQTKTIWTVLFLFSPKDLTAIISKNNLKCWLVIPQHTFPI